MKSARGAEAYEAHKKRMSMRIRAESALGREIGEIPPVAHPQCRARAKLDFRYFCKHYFPQTFSIPWSADHLKVIDKIESAVLAGGLFAMAMPRGSGKTSLCEEGCIWALVYGHRKFVALIGADETHAANMLESIKSEFENNDLLAEDFPEAIYPILKLEGIHQRAGGQLHKGVQTNIGWTIRHIVMPTIPGSCASGSVIHVAGITGRIRGMKHKLADGTSTRPSLVLIDDPQTDESAKSQTQCDMRERVLAGAILGLSGPTEKISGLMTVTVVRPDDMADRILDRSKHPQWQGERTKMVYQFPTNEALWSKYGEIRDEGLRAGQGLKPATAFYKKNRKAMDDGAVVSWKERFNYDELSAIQHAMNLKFQNEVAFWAEYQNEPLPEDESDDELLTPSQICLKINGIPKGEVPIGCSHLTMFIDVQSKALFYTVMAWAGGFTGYVIDYGTYPDQKSRTFILRNLTHTLARAAPRAGLEGSIYAGLEKLCQSKLGAEWKRDDGAQMRIDRCLIDANWGSSTEIVYQFCRQSSFSGILVPTHGKYVGASSMPMSEYKKKVGDRVGLNWRMPVVRRTRSVRHAIYDTNFWKSFVQSRLSVQMGDPGCMSLFGAKPTRHALIAQHLTAEYRIKTQGRGRTVDEWKLKASGVDNHWLDCVVGCHVGASMMGVALPGSVSAGFPRRKKKVKLSELQRQKRAQRH